jgi:hypothetical protein
MATNSPSTAARGVTRGKLILIGVLAVVFVFVVYWNYFRDSSTNVAGVAPARPSSSRRPVVSAKAAQADREGAAGRRAPTAEASAQTVLQEVQAPAALPTRSWPDFKLAEVLAYDPFALPAQFPQPPPSLAEGSAMQPDQSDAAKALEAARERAATLEEIKRQGVELVLQNGREYVAKIGDKEVRIGDKIGGFRVVDINLHGVTLEGDSVP